jgi:hypothetical protein
MTSASAQPVIADTAIASSSAWMKGGKSVLAGCFIGCVAVRLDEELPAFGGERLPLGLGVFADMLLELLCLEDVYEGPAVVYFHPNTLPLLIQSSAIGVSLGY